MSNRLYRIEILNPTFNKTYKKYELLAHGLDEIDKYSEKSKKVKPISSESTKEKTSTDYIIESLNYFKDEYNKARLTGIIYEYNLGPNFSLSNYEPETNEINHAFYRAKAIEQLHKIGFVKKYTIENRVMSDYGDVDDYAICEIDESKITQKEAPQATNAGVESIAQTIIHKHFFENSIQEKDIGLNIKNVEDNTIIKNNKKRITLPKFPRTEWSKVSIKFTDDRNAILSNFIEYKPFLPESIGCVDERTNKPDTAWEFLIKIAKGQGITEPINKKDREKQKKQKQKITDILRKIFKNQTDPFESEKGGVYRALFNVEYIKEENDKILIDKKYAGLEELRSKMTEPTQENIEYDLRHNIDPDTGSEFSQ